MPQTNFSPAELLNHIRCHLLNYLATRDYSEKKLIYKVQHLKKRYPTFKRYQLYTVSLIQNAINKLKAEGYIDDERYARKCYIQLQSTQGNMRIKQKLLQRLIPLKIIEHVLKSSDKSSRDYTQIISRVKQKKLIYEKKHLKNRTKYDVYGFLFRFLSQRGYSYSESREILTQAFGKDCQ